MIHDSFVPTTINDDYRTISIQNDLPNTVDLFPIIFYRFI